MVRKRNFVPVLDWYHIIGSHFLKIAYGTCDKLTDALRKWFIDSFFGKHGVAIAHCRHSIILLYT